MCITINRIIKQKRYKHKFHKDSSFSISYESETWFKDKKNASEMQAAEMKIFKSGNG
jgi:hypothetical protein